MYSLYFEDFETKVPGGYPSPGSGRRAYLQRVGNQIMGKRRLWISTGLLLAMVGTASAQTLARPGWVGNGLNTDPWWQRAVFYQVAAPPTDAVDFKYISARLDSLRALGVDALLLPAPTLPADGNAPNPALDDLDDLLRQASGQGMHVLLTLHAANPKADLSGIARFWLSRGVTGLYVDTPPETNSEDKQTIVQSVRKLASGALGQRIVISDLDLASPDTAKEPARHASVNRTSRASAPSVAQLQIDTRLNRLPAFDAASLRPLLAQTIAQPNLLLDIRPPSTAAVSTDAHPPLAELVAAIALVTHPASLIDSSANLVVEPSPDRTAAPEQPEQPAKPAPPPPPPGTYLPYVPYVPPAKPHTAPAPTPKPADPLTTWYRQLATLHHTNAVIRSGSKIFFDFDSQNALVWVNRPASPSPLTPPVVVACNLSSSPVKLSLGAAMKSLNLQGWFLRTLLRSDDAMGGQDINAVTVPPFGVYIGELRR
jgi:hypothetical protein